MKSRFLRVSCVVAVCLGATSSALAQTQRNGEADFDRPMRERSEALELTLGGGYSQGFGRFAGPQLSVGTIAQEGAAFELGVGYRLRPEWSLGAIGQYQEFRPATGIVGQTGSVGTRGMVAAVGATYHLRPARSVDPFAQLATGYRLLWEARGGASPTPDVTRHGFDVARFVAGVDLRANDDVAIAPVVGADLTAFAWNRTGGATTSPSVGDWGLSSFLFVGLQGRFDIGGVKRSTAPVVASTGAVGVQ